METPFPYVSQELIAALDQLYPDRCPEPGTAAWEVWFQAGRASVVRKLKTEFARQRSRDTE